MEGALFFYNKSALIKEILPKKPIGVLFLTSLRDIALEEYNGQVVKINNQEHYIKGVIEKTLEETEKGGDLNNLIKVMGVVVDDTESDLKGKFSLLPDGSNWIFPTSLLSVDKIWNIPSSFRKLSKEDLEGRKRSKIQFETLILEKALEIKADIIILDGYMAKIDYLQKSILFRNKVLNIHPAPTIITNPYCFRGKDEVMDAIRFAQSNDGVGKTGATLHFVNEGLDSGDPIAYICDTFVSGDDTEISLICRNYQQAKLPIFIAGLKNYALKIFPYL